MDLKTVEYFLSVAKYLNFTKAAGECYISQAAISQQIDKLERELELKLFVRSNRSVELTAAGKAFAEDVRPLLEQFEAAVSRAGKLSDGRAGEVRVGFLCQYEYQVLSEVLPVFRRAFPEVEVTFGYVDCREAEQLLHRREIDLALGSMWEFSPSRELVVERVFTDSISAVVSAGHPLAAFDAITAQQLRDQDIVMFDENNAPNVHQRMREDCRAYGFEPHLTARANTFDTMALMVEAGLGVALLPTRIKYRLGPGVKALDLIGSHMYHELAATRLADSANPAAAQFVRELIAHFKGQNMWENEP